MKKIMFNDKFGLTQAVLGGRKTMTRRIIKFDNDELPEMRFRGISKYGLAIMLSPIGVATLAPNYHISEVVAVAQSYWEIWNTQKRDFRLKIGMESEANEGFIFTKFLENGGWNNKMFVKADLMPHQIKITDIKVERLQDISDDDCLKEGISMLNDGDPMDGYFFFDRHRNIKSCYNTPREAFAALIDKVSGKGTWDSNPYVFAYSFEWINKII